jgi:DNA-binding IclR family transcriptional regulator
LITDTTVPRRAALQSELAAVGCQRYALEPEEYMLGFICPAVPIMPAGAVAQMRQDGSA